MSTTLRPNSHSNAMQQSNYIAEFKDKNQYEQRINTAWRRAESECVETLLEHSEISSELTDKIQNLAFDLAHSLRERKGSGGKAGIVQGLLQEFSERTSWSKPADVCQCCGLGTDADRQTDGNPTAEKSVKSVNWPFGTQWPWHYPQGGRCGDAHDG